MKKWAYGVLGVAGGLLVLGRLVDSTAIECVGKEEDKNWSFLTFYNTCKKPINVVFCNKMSLGEIGKLFGYNTGEWDCKRHAVPPGRSFATVKWVNENSSVASHLLSTSRYHLAACYQPYQAYFLEDGKFECRKAN